MDEFYGIDFGTTNSATVSVNKSGVITQFGDTEGQPYPSVVAINKTDGKVHMIGREVKDNRESLRDDFEIITSVKSILGTGKTWNLGDRTWRPYEVAAEILKGLKSEIVKRHRGELLDATIAIPVGFSTIKRKDLRQAAKLANINISAFVSEPTAAVYNHFEKVKKWGKVAVFDWGGGTLDISVVEINDGVIHELATSGMPLGGDDLDHKIAEWAHNQIMRKSPNIIHQFASMSPEYRDDLIVKSEWAKILMASHRKSEISTTKHPEAVPITFDNKTFLDLVRPEYDHVLKELRNTITSEAKCAIEEIGCILMVGGSSKILGLYDRMVDDFDCEVLAPDREKADWDIAAGAAKLNKSSGTFIISNTIGLILSDGTFFNLLNKGDHVNGDKCSIEFGLIEDTDNARFVFAELKDSRFKDTLSDPSRVGYLTVKAFGFSNESIKLNFGIDEDLVLKITAKSSNKSRLSEQTWNYEKLTFVYKLPQ